MSQRSSLDGGTREMKRGWLRKVDNWWFGKGSPVTMAVFRILMGTVALANLAMMLPFFDAWFTERGYVPLRIVKIYFGEDPRLNLIAGVTDPRITYAFYLLVMLAALLTTVGLWTRVSSIVLALGYITLHHRNPMILHGGDLMLRISLMYIALMPAGAAVSLDRLIALKRGKAPPVPAPVSLWPQRLMQYQIALVYLTTMWHKSRGHYWIDGSATWYPMHLNEFDRFWLPAFLTDNPLMVKISTWGTLAVELSLGTLVFYRPLRNWVLLAGLGLHAFIEYAFNIPLFAFTMVATYVNFFDGEEISAFGKRVSAWLARLGVRAGPARFQKANSYKADEETRQKATSGKTGGPS
jgi:hypothetical protein